MKTLMTPRSRVPLMSGWLNQLLEDDDLFGTTFLNRDITPAVNVLEDDKGYVIEFAAPGYAKDDFEVSMDGRMLNVRAEKKTEVEKEDERWMRKEFNYAAFTRTFTLPEDVREDKVAANYKDGILRIRLQRRPKSKKPEAKRIEIH